MCNNGSFIFSYQLRENKFKWGLCQNVPIECNQSANKLLELLHYFLTSRSWRIFGSATWNVSIRCYKNYWLALQSICIRILFWEKTIIWTYFLNLDVKRNKYKNFRKKDFEVYTFNLKLWKRTLNPNFKNTKLTFGEQKLRP